jgi:hypothetical protein
MSKYDDIQRIIAQSESFVEFADFGDGITEDWIKRAEERLGFELPNSYKWWLQNYGGGEIYGEEIYSIYEQDFDTVVGGDIVYMYELNRKNKDYTDNTVVICEANDDVYYFDLSVRNDEGEHPIFSLNNNGQYADDFIEFLKKRITES